MSPAPSQSVFVRLLAASAIVLLGTVLTATYFQTCLSSRQLASNFISPKTWFESVSKVEQGRHVPHFVPNEAVGASHDFANLPFTSTLIPCAIASLLVWVGGTIWLVLRRGVSWSEAAIGWGWYGWLWLCLVDLWEWIWILAGMVAPSSFVALLSVTPQFWLAGCLAGWMTAWLTIDAESVPAWKRTLKPVSMNWLWLICGIYVIVFSTMNWRLYANLLVPHGDSVMYEEHLWNLLHGKGFRSYLDRGLFLGEHIQFVHLFLLPLYALVPSHLLLELCSSAALALGAFPVFWMTRRHTGSDRVAYAAAVAYLLYFPMQFLDIEIDLKTFRPESFGIPLLLLTLDQLDRKSVIGTIIGVVFCLTVKEDYTLIFGPLGLWIAFSQWHRPSHMNFKSKPASEHSRAQSFFGSPLFLGLSLSLFSVGYLWLATRVIMPWFRSGVEVHYASYFSRFGKTPEEILKTWLTEPSSVADALLTPDTALYAIALLAPLAFIPLVAPGRLAVGLPLFAILCMNELEGSRTPQHQFHAPLVAIVFWSLAAALPIASSLLQLMMERLDLLRNGSKEQCLAILRRFLWTSSFATGLFFSLGPLGLSFWDPGSSWNWRTLYGPTHREAMFARIKDTIPLSARVASTDFVHPRFTHHERSYDYSEYQREVSGKGNRIPDDTDYVVIDTDHKYSKIKRPDDVPEWKEHPELWELLPDETDGVFIVLKRKSTDDGSTNSE